MSVLSDISLECEELLDVLLKFPLSSVGKHFDEKIEQNQLVDLVDWVFYEVKKIIVPPFL